MQGYFESEVPTPTILSRMSHLIELVFGAISGLNAKKNELFKFWVEMLEV